MHDIITKNDTLRLCVYASMAYAYNVTTVRLYDDERRMVCIRWWIGNIPWMDGPVIGWILLDLSAFALSLCRFFWNLVTGVRDFPVDPSVLRDLQAHRSLDDGMGAHGMMGGP